MNKTVNINLGGMFFHIDEDAYQKLTRYFDAIKRSLSNSTGQDEIIKDIEMRIGELITEKHTSDKQVINIKELDEVIAVMGQPEDYRIDNDDEPQTADFNTNRVTKKLYRDRENGVIGGVLSGLGHYFGIDRVWLRIAFLILIWFYGFGILAYIILWIVMPEAITTTEKLEMRGEPVTISNIERKVREEFENVSGKIKNVNYDEMGRQVKSGGERFATGVGDVFMSIFRVFAKLLGVILIICALPVLIFLLIGVFTLGSSMFIEFPWQDFIAAGNYSDYPIWSFGLLMFIAIGIPFFYLMLLGFKLLIDNMRSIGNVANYTLLALWLISVAIVISIGLKQLTAFAVDGRVIKKETLSINPKDTLLIKFVHNDYFTNNVENRIDFLVTQDSTMADVIYSNDVEFTIRSTDEKAPYLYIEKMARGKSIAEAKQTAEKINYGYKLNGNQLILDNYLLTEFKNKYRNQEIDITLYLPVGTLFKADSSVQHFDRSDDSFFNLHFSSSDYVYRVGKDQVKCMSCPYNENEHGDVEPHQDTLSTPAASWDTESEGQGKGLATDPSGKIIKKQ